jgi:hypothetical protein
MITDGREQNVKSINLLTVLDDMSTCFLHVEVLSF